MCIRKEVLKEEVVIFFPESFTIVHTQTAHDVQEGPHES